LAKQNTEKNRFIKMMGTIYHMVGYRLVTDWGELYSAVLKQGFYIGDIHKINEPDNKKRHRMMPFF
jgi:hypothetical protein